MSIHFTQYLRPTGQPKPVKIDRPPEIEKLAQEVVDRGGRFEVEVLRSGECSFEVVFTAEDGEERSAAAEICKNGPPVLDVVDRLVRTAHAALYHEELSDADVEALLRHEEEMQARVNEMMGRGLNLLGICPKCGSEVPGHECK